MAVIEGNGRLVAHAVQIMEDPVPIPVEDRLASAGEHFDDHALQAGFAFVGSANWHSDAAKASAGAVACGVADLVSGMQIMCIVRAQVARLSVCNQGESRICGLDWPALGVLTTSGFPVGLGWQSVRSGRIVVEAGRRHGR